MVRPRKRTPAPPADTAARTLSVDRGQLLSPTRFQLLSTLGTLDPGDLVVTPDLSDVLDGLGLPEGITFDVVRPDDLVVLTVVATGCDLVTLEEPRTAVLRPREGEESLLVVTYPFQHMTEEASYEESEQQQPDEFGRGPGDPLYQKPPEPQVVVEPVTPIVGHRPARSSRVVFRMDGDVEFTRAGVLAAMGRLPLVVHTSATPGTTRAFGHGGVRFPWGVIEAGPILHLGDGLVLQLTTDGPVIGNPTRAMLAASPVPDLATDAGRALLRDSVARARELLAVRAPTVAPRTRFIEGSAFLPGGDLVPEIVVPVRPRRKLSRPAAPTETAIEAPFRLQISPSVASGWAHATEPVPAADAPGHVELWHTRLAMRGGTDGVVDERPRPDRIVRAVWTRDRDGLSTWDDPDDDGKLPTGLDHTDDLGYITSLDRADRHMIVRQTSETWIGEPEFAGDPIPPRPVGADQLWLSSLGAWLDLHGAWDTLPYSKQALQAVLTWDHIAPMGRDQYVRVTYPGYLYPFGHNATLVKVTERKMKTVSPSVAGLYQRMFIVVNERSRTYPDTPRDLPFAQVDIGPLVTPAIKRPTATEMTSFFVPEVGGVPYHWDIDALDRELRPVKLRPPLLWVSQAFRPFTDVDKHYDTLDHRHVDLGGQHVSFVPKAEGNPDIHHVTETIHLRGTADLGTSTPRMTAATVRLEAVEQLSPVKGVDIAYDAGYLAAGLSTAPGQVWARTVADAAALEPVEADAQPMEFGSAGAGSDKAGGFMTPSLPIRGLTRDAGPVGDPEGMADQKFVPREFLAGALPQLFGVVPLDLLIGGLLPDIPIAEAPKVVTETLNRIDRLAADLRRVQEVARQAAQQVTSVAAQAQAVVDEAGDVIDAVEDLLGAPTTAAAGTVADELDDLAAAVTALAGMLPAPQARQELLRLAGLATEGAAMIREVAGTIDDLLGLLQDAGKLEGSFHFDWRPTLHGLDQFGFIEAKAGLDQILSLRVDGRAGVVGPPSVTVTAEIRNIALRLFETEPMMRLGLDHLYFKSGTSGKTEVDAQLQPVEFLGILSFVETIQDLIPLDGFSDPPFVEVDTEGARAGFTLAVPSVAVGVFNLSNISLGADVDVPFLGGMLTAGFNFCTREKPFTLTVMCLGGGGWLALRVAPDGLEVLELGLEATASLAVDFGVASGSISASVGVYMRLEGEQGSLTGYFRLRGEVDVLGLISASIELYMELVYHMDTGKLIGSATITVTVEVFVFSGSVSIHAERQLAGANADPSFRDVLDAADGTSPYWDDYCEAFA